jgi:PDDEXK-like domain of unknown function (DUF3799)
MNAMKPGLHTMTAAEYHADPAPEPSLSSSIAKILLTRSPYHAMLAHPRLNASFKPDTDSRLDLGSAAHALLLERDESRITWVPYDDWRTNAAKAYRDAAHGEGKMPVLAKFQPQLQQMVVIARQFVQDSELGDILDTGSAEQTMLWHETGPFGVMWFRARTDLLSADRRVVCDYKTVASAAPNDVIRQIGNMNYDLQAEFHSRGVAATTKVSPTFIFLAQEIDSPYACSLVALSEAYRSIGKSKVERAMRIWADCLHAKSWPGYDNRIHYAEPAVWQINEHIGVGDL